MGTTDDIFTRIMAILWSDPSDGTSLAEIAAWTGFTYGQLRPVLRQIVNGDLATIVRRPRLPGDDDGPRRVYYQLSETAFTQHIAING